MMEPMTGLMLVNATVENWDDMMEHSLGPMKECPMEV